MDYLKLIPLIFGIFDLVPKIRNALQSGGDVITVVKNTMPDILPILEQLGKMFFPGVTEPKDAAQAAIDVLADKAGTMWVQNNLNTLGQSPPLEVDGIYGKMTTAAVKAFQTAHPPLEADGWSGPLTSVAIADAVSKLPPK